MNEQNAKSLDEAFKNFKEAQDAFEVARSNHHDAQVSLERARQAESNARQRQEATWIELTRWKK